MKHLCLAFAVTCLLAVLGRPALADALLRPNVVVDGDVVRLGDLFDNVGDKADSVVARAPAPGKRVTVDADWLVRVARMNGIVYKPSSLFEQAVVQRSGVTIGNQQMEAELHQALFSQGVSGNFEVELVNRNSQVTVPVGAANTVAVRDLAYDSRYKRFTATIEVPADSPNAQRVRVSGRVFNTIDVPVPARPLAHADVITPADLTWIKAREETLRRDIVLDTDQIVGMVPRQGLRSGQMISNSDLQRPVVVARGAVVTMVLVYGTMTLTAQGRAVEPGCAGDIIRVTNSRSLQTVEAKVEGPNRVSVAFAGSIAMSN